MTGHHIEIGDSEVKPIRLTPYRLPHSYHQEVQKELRDMEETGIIERFSSDWTAPIVLVRRKMALYECAWTTDPSTQYHK